MSKWRETHLGELAEIIPGFAFKSSDFESEGDIVVKIKNIVPPIIDLTNTDKVNLRKYSKNKLEKYLLEVGDYVVAMTGATIGKVGRLKENKLALINQRVAKIKAKKGINNDYIYYLLQSNDFHLFIQNNIDSHSAQENISGSSIGKFPISLPPLPEQTAIASVLSSLDDKIDLLHRQNATLEKMAETLFRQWFVEEAKEEWDVMPLGRLVTVKRGGSPRPIQDYLSDTGLRWLKISDATKETSPYIFEIKEHIKIEGLNKTSHLKPGTLVLSNSATPGIPKILQVDSCIHDGWLHFPKSHFSNMFLYLLFKKIRPELLQQGNGSIFTNLKTDILKEYLIPIPDKESLLVFDNQAKPVFEKILNNTIQIRTLIALRDTLLPKLMSGEVKVEI